MDVRKFPKASGEVPSVSLNASLSKLMASVNSGRRQEVNIDNEDSFLPSKTFQGARPGFVFATGVKGTGYYVDPMAPVSERRKRKKREEVEDRLNPEELLKMAEENAKTDSVLDAKSLKKLASNFEKKYAENLEQRMKYSDDPSKFMDSEVDLDEALQNLFGLVNSPDLYPIFIQTNILNSLLNLLLHENRDLAADTVQLLSTLTDTTDNEEWIKEFKIFVEALITANAPDQLLTLLLTLDDQISEEDASTVFNILTILDNLIDVCPELGPSLIQKQDFMNWIVLRLSRFEFDSNKQLCGELLVQILQTSEKQDHAILKKLGILKILFESIKQNAISQSQETEDELEFTENLFDAFCCFLLDPATKIEFVEDFNGIEMALEIIKKRRALRIGGLKLIEFATTGSRLACQHLLDAFGLKTVFSIFMEKLKVREGKDPELNQKMEEISITIISNLLQGLIKDSERMRVGAKFVENEFEKCDRLFEFYFIYHARVLASDQTAANQEPSLSQRLGSGLATLQQICLIVCHLWEMGDKALKQRVLLLLHQKQHTLENVRSVVIEMMEMIGEDSQGQEEEKQKFQSLLDALAMESRSESEKKESEISKEEVKQRILKKRKMKQQGSTKATKK